MKTRSPLFLITAFFLCLPALAHAGFRAMPIKIYFDAKTKTAALNIENDGGKKTTIQLEAVEWSHDEKGTDIYTPARDLIFFPKILTIEPGEQRIVRVGYEGPVGDTERTYRLFLQELPTAQSTESAVNMTLRMGLPVFVKPVKEKPMSSMDLALANGTLEVNVKNRGNSHIVVNRISAEGTDKGAQVFLKEIGGWYTHAGNSRIYKIELTEEECLKTGEIRVQATSGNSVMEQKLTVDKGDCARP